MLYFLIGLIVVLMVGVAAFAVYSSQGQGVESQAGKILASQRGGDAVATDSNDVSTLEKVQASRRGPERSSRRDKMTLERKLQYGGKNMPVFVYRLIELVLATIFFIGATLIDGNFILKGLGLVTGPLLAGWWLNRAVNKRTNAFDKDYAPFLMQVTSLLKTGMNAMSAIEEAAASLENTSLVRQEVYLMLERLRFGVSEDKSIGAFGENVNHPEIELFVQAVILSRRLGGNLSETLDKLAKSVRSRQKFRQAAQGAVGMQRGSIWFILAIMVAMEGYLYAIYPDGVKAGLEEPVGWMVWQVGLAMIYFGIWLVNHITKIKV